MKSFYVLVGLACVLGLQSFAASPPEYESLKAGAEKLYADGSYAKAHDAYGQGPVPDKLAAANERTTLFCQIETAEGAENADAIAAVDGIDGLWIGHFDLSVSLGIPGQFNHPKFLKAVERTIVAAKKHKRALGRLVPTTETGIALYKQGFDFCCYSGDVWVLRDALAAAITTLREGCTQ